MATPNQETLNKGDFQRPDKPIGLLNRMRTGTLPPLPPRGEVPLQASSVPSAAEKPLVPAVEAPKALVVSSAAEAVVNTPAVDTVPKPLTELTPEERAEQAFRKLVPEVSEPKTDPRFWAALNDLKRGLIVDLSKVIIKGEHSASAERAIFELRRAARASGQLVEKPPVVLAVAPAPKPVETKATAPLPPKKEAELKRPVQVVDHETSRVFAKKLVDGQPGAYVIDEETEKVSEGMIIACDITERGKDLVVRWALGLVVPANKRTTPFIEVVNVTPLYSAQFEEKLKKQKPGEKITLADSRTDHEVLILSTQRLVPLSSLKK